VHKVALVYRGGIARIDSRFSLSKNQRSQPYVDFRRCIDSVEQHIKKANPEYTFDTYIHCWNRDLQDELIAVLQPANWCFPNAKRYRFGILIRVFASYVNQIKKNDFRHLSEKMNKISFQREYAGISQALSIRLALNLIKKESENNYEVIILLRPDVLLFRDIKIDKFNKAKITLNNSGKFRGDFRFVFPPAYLEGFRRLYNATLHGSVHKVHFWISRYLQQTYGNVLEEDYVIAGKDEEVARKIQD